MKQCSTCREEFADKFSFCPVDGTPLAENVEPAVNSSLPEREQPLYAQSSHADNSTPDAGEATLAAGGLVPATTEYHLTFLDDT
jgi:hypothetical protein